MVLQGRKIDELLYISSSSRPWVHRGSWIRKDQYSVVLWEIETLPTQH
jgi:hypothetical protein